MSSLLAALGCAAVFVQGVVRDQRIGEPVLRIDFPSAGEWTSTRFRVWGAGPRTLSMSSVNQDPQFVGAELEAAFEVAVVHSDGRTFFHAPTRRVRRATSCRPTTATAVWRSSCSTTGPGAAGN